MSALRRRALVWGLACLAAAGCIYVDRAEDVLGLADVRVGDVLFQQIDNRTGRLICAVTDSRLNHCGIVVPGPQGELCVLEAVGPVTRTPLKTFVARGRGTGLLVTRFREPYRGQVRQIVQACLDYQGAPYDTRFEPSADRLYCTELIAQGFEDVTGDPLGARVRIGILNWRPYEREVREYFGGAIPLDREVLTPADLAAAPQIERVWSNMFGQAPRVEKRWRVGVGVGGSL